MTTETEQTPVGVDETLAEDGLPTNPEFDIDPQTEATDQSPTSTPDGCDVAEDQEPETDTGTSVVHVPVSAPATVHFSQSDIEALKETIGDDLTPAQFHIFLEHAKRAGLDPMAKQIYAWSDRGKLVTMISIDGLRLVRDRTGKYLGPVGPQWCGKDGKWRVDENGDALPWLDKDQPAAARFGVRHADHETITWGIATWQQYGQTKGLWTKGGGPHMLAKCAEAIASRMAFPNELSGVYTPEEIPESVIAVRADDRPATNGRRPEPVQTAVTDEVDATMSLFNALNDEDRAEVERRWDKMAEAGDIDEDDRQTIDDGALYEWPKAWVDPISAVIVKMAERANPTPPADDDDGIVEAELVQDDPS